MENKYCLTAEDREYLRSIFTDRVCFDEEINEKYFHDELTMQKFAPQVLIEPDNAEEISLVMKFANKHKLPVIPRGQGTGLVGGAVAVNGGILLSTIRMNRILELDEANLTVTVEPGVLLMDLIEFVEKEGLFYPPDPGEKSATLGGNISTNAGGMRAVKYGVTRDYVRGLEAVLPSGELITVGGKTVKNSSGYSLKDLLVGSEGTLAIITKAILRLLPKPRKVISLLVPFNDFSTAIEAVPVIIRSRYIPTAIEFLQREVIRAAEEFLGKVFPDKSADAYLLLSFDGNSKQELENLYSQVADICLEQGANDVLLANTDDRMNAIWSARGAFLEAIKASTSEMDECDVVVPRDCVDEFIKYTLLLQERHDIRLLSFGHAGDGNLHIYVLRDDLAQDIWQKKLSAIMDDLYAKAREFNGQVSGEHGIGYAKRSYLRESIGETNYCLMQQIKQVFDPLNILNPNKII